MRATPIWMALAIGTLGCSVGDPNTGGLTGFGTSGSPTAGPTTMSDSMDPSATSSDPSDTMMADTEDPGTTSSDPDTATSMPPMDTGCEPGNDGCSGDCTDDPMVGEACETGMQGICATGIWLCEAGMLVCDPDEVALPGEACNGLDDDCNGDVDDGNPEGGGACSTGMPGPCAAGTNTCTMGVVECVPDTAPAGSDTCGDMVDNDCNGVVDDGCINCHDFDLGSAVPQSTNGSNVGGNDSFAASCGAGGGADTLYLFTANAAGLRTFDTFGSGFDTVLVAYSDCNGTEITCNDDTGGLQSQISVNMAAGQSIVIAVDGYAGDTGNFTLNVN